MKKAPVTYNIAYTLDYRGDGDDIPTFVFRGVPLLIIETVFEWLGRGGYFFGSVVVDTEFDYICRNGYGCQRVFAKLKEFNYNSINIDNFAELVEARLHAETTCKIKRMKIDKFLNI